MLLSNRVSGLCVAALGGFAAYGGSRLPPVPGQQIGPSVFPMVVGIGLVVCGAMIALGIGQRFEDEAEAELAAHSDQAASPAKSSSWWGGLLALVPPALLLFYVMVVNRLGFLPTAAVIVFCAALALGARLGLAVAMAIGGPLFVNLIFSKLLRVPLPSGFLPLPWLGLP